MRESLSEIQLRLIKKKKTPSNKTVTFSIKKLLITARFRVLMH